MIVIADHLSSTLFRLMKFATIIIAWGCVLFAGIFLRFEDLSRRPFHADEATGGRITATRLETAHYRFDPHHFHGPLLSDLAMPICRLTGETRWQTMTKFSLRLLPAIAGSLLLALPLLGRRRFGDVPMLLGSAFLATSPLLVYYSRMFIHEPLLVLAGMAALFGVIRFPRYGLPGLMLGLMAATKETFAISLIAWTGALGIVMFTNFRQLDRPWQLDTWQRFRSPLMFSIAAAVISAGLLYSDFLRQPHALVDAVRTLFVYQTTSGHEKPFYYFLQLFALPLKSGGIWWFGTPVILLAGITFLRSFQSNAKDSPVIHFLAYSAVGHVLIYSCIAYKTPWLGCLPWAHVCLLAGFSGYEFRKSSLWSQRLVGLLIAISLITQAMQARNATGRLSSDERNPFAYVPTRLDLETLEPWLLKLRKIAPNIMAEPIAVIGSGYWPLPWYLRAFDKIGYWPVAPDHLESYAVVIAMPEQIATTTRDLTSTHVVLPRGLRSGVPMTLLIRNDLWQQWNEEPQP
jgi:uncharacterized protein (TIGR03663 family)